MKRILQIAAVMLGLLAAGLAQNFTTSTGRITSASASCVGGSCVYYQLPPLTGWVNLTVSGTWAGTLLVEAVNDPSATYTNLNSQPWNTRLITSVNGSWSILTSGATFLLVHATTLSSGSVGVSMTATPAMAIDGPVFPTKVTAPKFCIQDDCVTNWPGATLENVRAYGAVGNNVHDDAPAVHAATNAVIAAGGGTVYFPDGDYYLNTLQVPPFDGIVNVSANHLHFVCAPGAVIHEGTVLNNDSTASTVFHLGYPISSVNFPTAFDYAAGTIASIGASSITLTTHADAANFVQGDIIYLRGDIGQDGQRFGEFNYVASANSSTGVVTLTKPLSLPYPTVLTAVKATSLVYQDVSIEGCEVHAAGDFSFIGQVVGTKITNNKYYVVDNGAPRGAFINSYQPLSDIEVSGNTHHGLSTAGASWF